MSMDNEFVRPILDAPIWSDFVNQLSPAMSVSDLPIHFPLSLESNEFAGLWQFEEQGAKTLAFTLKFLHAIKRNYNGGTPRRMKLRRFTEVGMRSGAGCSLYRANSALLRSGLKMQTNCEPSQEFQQVVTDLEGGKSLLFWSKDNAPLSYVFVHKHRNATISLCRSGRQKDQGRAQRHCVRCCSITGWVNAQVDVDFCVY